MTVIAWDGRTLAADKLASIGGGIGRTVTKIQKFKGSLLAITGSWDVGVEIREWWKAGASPSEFPARAREDIATLIVIELESIRSYASGPYPLYIEAEQCAFGSGRDYAEAAMYLGKTAEEAVAVACHFQTDCGRGIDLLRLSE